jgi:hypothetical protein
MVPGGFYFSKKENPMCLIIHKPASLELHESWLRDFYVRNKDGYGFMYSEGGRLYVHKSLGDVERFVTAFKARMGKELLVHLRMRTHGDIDLDNCHPYEVLTPALGGVLGAVWMMHNGVLSSGNQADTKKSDTWHYIQNVMVPLLRRDPELLLEPAFQKLVKGDIGHSNKFTFMTSRGDVVIINREAGSDYNGAWMSNTYAWNAPNKHYQGGYGYEGGYQGSYGGSHRGGYGGYSRKPEPKTNPQQFFALLRDKKFDKAHTDLTFPQIREAIDHDEDAYEEMVEHIKTDAFIPGTDDEFIIKYVRMLGKYVLSQAQQEEIAAKKKELDAKKAQASATAGTTTPTTPSTTPETSSASSETTTATSSPTTETTPSLTGQSGDASSSKPESTTSSANEVETGVVDLTNGAESTSTTTNKEQTDGTQPAGTTEAAAMVGAAGAATAGPDVAAETFAN